MEVVGIPKRLLRLMVVEVQKDEAAAWERSMDDAVPISLIVSFDSYYCCCSGILNGLF